MGRSLLRPLSRLASGFCLAMIASGCGLFGGSDASKGAAVTQIPADTGSVPDLSGDLGIPDGSADCKPKLHSLYCRDADVLPLSCWKGATTYERALSDSCPTAGWTEIYDFAACDRLVVRSFAGSPGVITYVFDAKTHELLGANVSDDMECTHFADSIVPDECKPARCNLACFKSNMTEESRDRGCGGPTDGGVPVTDAWAPYDGAVPW